MVNPFDDAVAFEVPDLAAGEVNVRAIVAAASGDFLL
jgi:hypothetical protein